MLKGYGIYRVLGEDSKRNVVQDENFGLQSGTSLINHMAKL